MQLKEQLHLIEQIDQLICLQATGTASELVRRLEITKLTLYRLIVLMREMNAPVCYDVEIRSFVYDEKEMFTLGFDLESEFIPYYSIHAGKFSKN
ncbi:hypothetical protein AB832_01290 [Flavobacteriaceae bacterium (ex Bugula neritina AB1)]|nr:hypothetical protein AB832_01290 [Flavobacteriaceae bacterium (ex Bugula neritina AB1)]